MPLPAEPSCWLSHKRVNYVNLINELMEIRMLRVCYNVSVKKLF